MTTAKFLAALLKLAERYVKAAEASAEAAIMAAEASAELSKATVKGLEEARKI